MSFNQIIEAPVRGLPPASPDHLAMSFNGTVRLTYRELEAQTRRYGAALRALGLTQGDRLGLLLFNTAEYLPLLLASARLGVIVVRLNFRLTAPELRFILGDSDAKVVISHRSLLDRLGEIRADVPVQTYVVVADSDDPVPSWAVPATSALQADQPLAPADLPAVTDADPMSLIYTSGTTGSPKGALWSHGNTLAIATAQALRWGLDSATVTLVPGPLYHAGGFEAFLSPTMLMQGRAVYLGSGNFTVDHLLEVMHSEEVTDCLLFPFMLEDLLRRDDLETILPSSLRRFFLGGEILMPSTAAELKRRLPDVALTQVYGLTEGGAIATTLEDADFLSQPRSVGRPLPLTEVRVVDTDGAEVSRGEVGEIEVRGPAVSAGYWQRPEANAVTFHDGWCRTGDLGSVNEDGFLILAGRQKDMIRSGGENVYPAEVEKVIAAHPAVDAVTVVGVPDERFGEVGCALVIASAGSGLDADGIRAFAKQELAGYKVPRHFVFVEEFPRNASGKVLKFELQKQYRDIGTAVNG